MGILLKSNLDTELGSSKGVYVRIENINLNRTFGRVKVAVTYWLDQNFSEEFKHSVSRHPDGLLTGQVVHYEGDGDLGTEITLPTYFEFDLAKPKKIKVPIYEEKEVFEEIPFISFDELGRKQVKTRKVKKIEKVKIGEKDDITQALDFDLEFNLIPWCYGQVKAQLAELLPANELENQ